MMEQVLKRTPDDVLVRVAAQAYRDWMDAPPRYCRAAEDAYLLLLDEVLTRRLGDELMALTA